MSAVVFSYVDTDLLPVTISSSFLSHPGISYTFSCKCQVLCILHEMPLLLAFMHVLWEHLGINIQSLSVSDSYERSGGSGPCPDLPRVASASLVPLTRSQSWVISGMENIAWVCISWQRHTDFVLMKQNGFFRNVSLPTQCISVRQLAVTCSVTALANSKSIGSHWKWQPLPSPTSNSNFFLLILCTCVGVHRTYAHVCVCSFHMHECVCGVCICEP